MTPEEREDIFGRLREFARDQREAADLADANSLGRAADLAQLYEDKGHWVGQLDPPKKETNRGRPVDPGSQNRFTIWLKEKTDVGLQPRQVKALLGGWLFMCDVTHKSRLAGERAIRPFYQLRRRGLEDHLEQVMAEAVMLAGDGPVTSEHTRQAVREFIAKQPKPKKQQVKVTPESVEDRLWRSRAALEELAEQGRWADLARHHKWLTGLLDEALKRQQEKRGAA